jgi:hypothetical protein
VSELKHPTSRDQPPIPLADRPDRPAGAKVADATARREPYAAHFDRPLSEGGPSPREVLGRFDPRRANLPDLSPADAGTYLQTHATDRPWLARARGHDTAVQRLFAALDQGRGHALERHEGYPSDSLLDFRVRYLQDPAQLDLTKRLAGEDAFKPGKDHRCGDLATRIGDPEAFATAFARGIDHPEVRAVLAAPYVDGPAPDSVGIPIADLLGPDGHRFCSGVVLRPVGGSIEAARDCRLAWVDAARSGREPEVPAPAAEPIRSFEGGTIEFVFGPDRSRRAYEVITMYAEPKPDEESS